MKISSPFFGAAILAFAVVSFTAPKSSHADTYRIFLLVGESGFPEVFQYPVGITASGTLVVWVDPTDCGGIPGHCYETFDNGVMVSQSRTAPNFTYDNGSDCTPDASFSAVFTVSVCNNGHELYSTSIISADYGNEIFTGPDPIADFFAPGELANALLNSSGDFVYDVDEGPDGNGAIIEAIDLTPRPAPEPGSVFLLGTGILAALSFPRRRQQHN